MIEWVGSRCSGPRRKSVVWEKGDKEKQRMLILVSRSFEAAFPVRYPRSMCPTANMAFSSVFARVLSYK
jgi:hypothetical protein